MLVPAENETCSSACRKWFMNVMFVVEIYKQDSIQPVC